MITDEVLDRIEALAVATDTWQTDAAWRTPGTRKDDSFSISMSPYLAIEMIDEIRSLRQKLAQIKELL